VKTTLFRRPNRVHREKFSFDTDGL